MARFACLVALCCGILPAQQVDRTKPPETPPLAEYKLPPLREGRLSNGLRYVFVEDRRFPLITLRMGFEAGSKYDLKELSGLAETAAALLKEGTPTRTSQQIAAELAAIGGTLEARTSPDHLTIRANCLAEYTPRLLSLVADVVRNASFPEEEVNLRKANRIQELLDARAQSSTLADERFRAAVYGPHPYARVLPTRESLERITRQALLDFRARHLAPNHAVLILLGALPPAAELRRMVEREFGGWAKKPLAPAPAAKFPDPVRALFLVDRPGSAQADIHVGRLAVPRTSPEYFPLLVANSILGGAASSRMFMNIREKQGFAYDAHSEFAAAKEGGVIRAVTQVRPEVVGQALESVLAELKGMAGQPVGQEELTAVKNYRSGQFVIGLETQDGLASQLLTVKTMGLAGDYLERYVSRIRLVGPAAIQTVAKKYLSPEQAVIVVVGDASQLGRQLEKFGKVIIEKAP